MRKYVFFIIFTINMRDILYIHGMGGGEDSRIPSILKMILPEGVRLTVRTYDFDPDIAREQILSWCNELKPCIIIGESLGSLQALRISGPIPKILVSPSLGAPRWLNFYGWLCLIPGVSLLLGHIYKPTRPGRQRLHFSFKTLRKYPSHGKLALSADNPDVYAFFGKHDHYRKYGVVSLRLYRKYFGDSFEEYDGIHFMEEEFVESILLDRIVKTLERVKLS